MSESIKVNRPKKYKVYFLITKNPKLNLTNINFHANFFNSYLTI